MVDFKEALDEAVNAAFCSVSATVEATVALGEEWYDNQGFPGAPPSPTPLGAGLRAARNLLCGEPPDAVDSSFDSLLPNGQCPGTLYRVRADRSLDGGPPAFAGQGTGPGPVKRNKGKNDPEGEFDNIEDANGVFLTGGGTTFDQTYDLVNIEITPLDGPDDCGASPPEPVQPYFAPDFTTTPDVTYTPPGGGPDITVPVGLVFAPVSVDLDGTINVPVQIDVTGFASFNANLNLNTGNLVLDLGVNENNFTTINDTTIINDNGGPPGDTPTDEEEIQATIIGVYVVCTIDDDVVAATELVTATAPVGFYVPRLADVSFHCELLSAPGLGWIRDVPVKYERQFIPCPVPWGAKSVAVTTQDGVSVQVTLVRAKSERDLLLSAAMV